MAPAPHTPAAHLRLGTGALGCAALLMLGLAPTATATVHDEGNPEIDWDVTDSILDGSVTAYDPQRSITEYDRGRAVAELGGSEAEDDEVIVLEADILFASHEWDLPENINEKLEELTEEIPEGADIEVHGHTDSLPVDESQYDFDNQELSENRAQAVADALADVREDLEMDVEGFGEDQPAVTEDDDDPSTFAANRRVEIRYD